jgi:hypothetical protein
MKIKMLAFAALVSIAEFASAQSVTVGYAYRDLDAGTSDHQTSLSVKTASFGSFTGDIGIQAAQSDATNVITNRTELGLTYGHPLSSSLKADLRVGHGWKAKSGSTATQYYVVEPSVTAKLGDTPMSVKLGYRYREAYSNTVADTSNTTRLSVGYALTAKDSISLGRDWQRGDGALTQTSLQYTRAF